MMLVVETVVIDASCPQSWPNSVPTLFTLFNDEDDDRDSDGEGDGQDDDHDVSSVSVRGALCNPCKWSTTDP